MDFDVPSSQKDRHLPMIINLRGDEELVEQFNWDAEQVMEFLGIKRSRLTQISGKELRVARIRRDRYLRPVYRESDVRDYQEWTRATATHQSSSRAIEQAIDSLDDRFSDLLVVLQEKLLQLEERSNALLAEHAHHLDAADFSRFRELQELHRDQESQLQLLAQGQEFGQRALESQGASLKLWFQEFAELKGFLANFHQDIRGLAVALQGLKRDQEAQQVVLLEGLQDMKELIRGLQSGQNQIIEQTRPAEPEPDVQRRPERQRTRRRRAFRSSNGSESSAASPQSNP